MIEDFIAKLEKLHITTTDNESVDVRSLWSEHIACSRDYAKMSKSELQELCRLKGLPVSGTKGELCDRLHNPTQAQKKVKTVKKSKKRPPVLQRMENLQDAVCIRKNAFGNFEHAETKLIFDQASKSVVGKQERDRVIPLTEEDIEICKENNWDFVLPETI